MSEQDPAAAFRVEAADVLDATEQALLDLTHNLSSRELIDTVFRGMHTLKGSGAMFGFDALAGFTHHCETAFDRVRKGLAPATPELVATTLSAMDHMRALVEGGSDELESAGATILARLQASLGSPPAASTQGGAVQTASIEPDGAVVTPESGGTGWHIVFYLPSDAMANGTNPSILLDELRELGETRVTALTDKIPELTELDPVQCHIGWNVELRGSATREDIDDVFIFVMDDMDLFIEPLTPDEATVEPEAPPSVAAPSAAPLPSPAAPSPNTPAAVARKVRPVEETVRVPAGRLDVLMDRVGELVIVQSRLAQLAETGVVGATGELALRSISEEVERLASELRDTTMVLRMVPVTALFARFRRLVHDLAHETGKSIEFLTEGESTEIDKTVSEQLADPIVHLVRNACDHGLEPADERSASGKNPAGTIVLSAEQAGGEVLITIQDDGRGINLERVRAKAQANGLIQPGQVLSDHELMQMIFHPGFSTAEHVTNLSGRGVGMDVVKRTIEGLRGTIDMASDPGKGSRVTLRIPLTLAIIEGLLVRVGTGNYVIPLAAVEECIELRGEDDIRSRGRSMIQLRDSLIPFLRLRELFATGTPPDPFQKIVVIGTAGERVGLVVDQIIGSHQTVIKSMSPLHRDIPSFSGATILGDGGVALILDVVQLIALGQQQEERLRAAG